MSLIVVLGIAVGLSVDAMGVAVASSLMLGKVTWGQVARFSLSFGGFQAAMPVAGWLAGREIERFISAWDHWIAFGLLVFIGAKSIYETITGREKDMKAADPTKGLSLLVLSLATSMDALGVGLNFGLLGIPVWRPAVIIGCVTACLVALGMLFAGVFGSSSRKGIQVFGGVVLIIIAFKILIDHTLL